MPSCWPGAYFGFCLPLMEEAMEPDLGEGYHEAPSQGDGWRWVGDGHLASGTLLDAGMCLLPHTAQAPKAATFRTFLWAIRHQQEAQILSPDFLETSHRFWGWTWQLLCPLLGGGRRLGDPRGTQQPRALPGHEGFQHVLWQSPMKNTG